MSEAVIWHDLECGGYDVDLPLWRELAEAAHGPVLDLGAGTGRVTLDLARRGHEVCALDVEAELVAALRRRVGGLQVEALEADARDFSIDQRFGLVLVPMQTIQLMDDAGERARVLACAHRHTAPGGTAALAIADALEGYDAEHQEPPLPDIREVEGVLYASRPVRVADEGERVRIERLREVVGPGGQRTESADVVRLARLSAEQLEAEGTAAGFRVAPRRSVPQTDEFVGSTVVMLRV